jgi:hypothetical protein
VPTQWDVESRKYYFDRWDEGVAQRVRAEREDGMTRAGNDLLVARA